MTFPSDERLPLLLLSRLLSRAEVQNGKDGGKRITAEHPRSLNLN